MFHGAIRKIKVAPFYGLQCITMTVSKTIRLSHCSEKWSR